MTVIADRFEGKALNSPNDIVPHPDGSIWFTDPPYGDRLTEGIPDEAGGPTNPQGMLNPRIGAPNAGIIGGKRRELPTAVYRWDPSGKLEVVNHRGAAARPERAVLLARLQDALRDQHRQGPGDTGAGGKRDGLRLRRAGHARCPTSGCLPT